jgi:hypothetical protein
MELEDLKNDWEAMNTQVNKQIILNADKIDQMTQIKYHSKLKKIVYPEMFGSFICLAGIAFIFLNFSKLDSLVLKATGIVAILLLLTISVLSQLSIRPLRLEADMNNSHSETLKSFAGQKIRFHKLQRANITLSYLLLVTTAILLSKFVNGQDISDNKWFWTFSITFGYTFLVFYSKWTMKSYGKTLKQAEELLKELTP